MKKYRKIILLICLMMFVISGCSNATGEETSVSNKTQVDIVNSENTILTENVIETEETVENTEGISGAEGIELDTQSEMETFPEVDVTEKVLYAQSEVNVRSNPSTEGEKLGMLSINQEVVGLGDAVDGWQKIRYGDEIAYVSAQYLGTEKVVIQTYEPQRQVDEITAADLSVPVDFDPNGIVVVIDAGHQGKGNSQQEPDGPGSSVFKAKVTSGATGCATNQQEYILNLQVSLKLRDELRARGYQVAMIREGHEINISNSERAKFANNLGADAFIRIHANSAGDSSVSGVETICQTAANPYNAHLYADSRRLSDCILDGFVESTGAKKRRVWETDTMSGINWCEVPVTILEMGFLSNPEEDRLMASEDYQNKMVQGIANGLDKFFNR